MARPTNAPRLSTIAPEHLAAETVERMYEHLARIAAALYPMKIDLAATFPAFACVLAQRVRDLCGWAQHGHGDPGVVQDLILNVAGPLLTRPVDPTVVPGSKLDREIDAADLGDPIMLVLLASRARLRLMRGEMVSARELAALSSRSPESVRHLLRQGALRANESGLVAAVDADKWLRQVQRSAAC